MTTQINVFDRLRIERAVWSLDQRLYDLPRKIRVARRRELRANLTAAAVDVGAATAIRDLGRGDSLAAEYLDAELGPGPRHSWIAASLFVATATLVLNSLFFAAAQAFGDGVLAGDADADGTYRWSGISLFQSEVSYTFDNGSYTHVGGAFSPLTWLLLAIGAIAVGRLWRAIPRRRTHHAH